MKNKSTEKNILIAFLLNLFFSIFEIFGGIFTNSVAIISDSIHDFIDAISLGLSYFLEKKSKQKADSKYTYGYVRFSLLGGVITTTLLLVSSLVIIYSSVIRLFNPVKVNYSGMIIFAIVGIILNSIAAFITRDGESINQKSVNLHMLEDVFGWIVIFVGAVLMNFLNISILDSIMSLAFSVFILVSAFKNFKKVIYIFLEKTPKDIDINELKKSLLEIKGVDDVYHIHLWSIDGYKNYATMHIITKNKKTKELKQKIRQRLLDFNISHVTIEIEDEKYEESI